MVTRRTVAALLVAAALPLSFALVGAGGARAQDAAEPLADKVLGDPEAPVTIIEYASMTCPHCADFHASVFPLLKEEYIDTGKAKFVLREFPLDEFAAATAMLARCSDERYYDVVDLFFETQRQWAVREGAYDQIRSLALQAGFTGETFEACLRDQALLDGINAVKDEGYRTMNVTSTPTLIVDGEKVDRPTIGAMRRAIDAKLD